MAATPVTSRKIRDPHSFSGADVSQQLSSDVTRMKWKALEIIISIFSLYLRQFLHTFVFSSLEEVHFHLQTQEPVITSIYCSGGRIKTWMKQEKVLQGNL